MAKIGVDVGIPTSNLVGGPSFSPSDLPNLDLWLKSDVGITQDVGVTTWADQSGNGNDATQTVDANEPALVASQINGLPVVRFNGTSHYMAGTLTASSAQPNSLFVVGKFSNTTGNRFIFDGDTANNRHALYLQSGSAIFRMYSGTSLADGASDTSNHYFSCIFNGTSSSMRIDGASAASGNASTESIQDFVLGGAFDYSSLCAGDIAEIILYTDEKSGADRINIEQYLANKYALPQPSFPGSPTHEWRGDVGVTGDPVTAWADQVGSLDLDTASGTPDVVSSWSNGRNAIYLNNESLRSGASTDTFPASTAFRLGWVFERTETAGQLTFGDFVGGTSGFRIINSGGFAGRLDFEGDTTNTVLTATGEFAINTKYVMVVERDASGNLVVWKNNVDVTSGSPVNAEASLYDSLTRSGSGNSYGRIAHIISYHDASASAADISSYLNAVWAIY
jgi:hypothetical protein